MKKYKWTILEAAAIINAPTKKEKAFLMFHFGIWGFSGYLCGSSVKWFKLKADKGE